MYMESFKPGQPEKPQKTPEFETAESLKEKTAVSHEKEKIEEKEEIIELTREEKEPGKAEINNLTRLLKSVREGRRELAESEIEWKNRMTKGTPGYKEFKKDKELVSFHASRKNENVKEHYYGLRKDLVKHLLVKAEKRWGKDSENFAKFRDEMGFKGFVGKERERFQKAKEEAMGPKEKGRLRKLYETTTKQFAKIPKSARWGISAGLGTAVALGTGGVALPAALGYAGFRFGRAALGSFSAVGAKALGDMAEKQWLKKHGKEAREEKIKESLRKEAANVSDLEEISYIVMEKTDKRNEELAKLAKRQKQWRVGKVAAMIAGGAGISFWAGSIDSFSHEPQISAGAKDQLGVKPDGPFIKELEAVPTGPRISELPPSPGIKVESFIETAKPGDSVWKLAEHQLENQGYFKNLSGTAEEIAGKKTYLIDWVKDKVALNPEKFGLADPDKLAIGQKIDFSEILKDKEGILKAFEETEKLSSAEISHINYNNELLSKWVKSHPDEILTTPKVAEILGGKRLEILIQEKPPVGTGEILAEPQEQEIGATAEDYLAGLAHEGREMIDARWEDYTKLPKLSEEEMLDLQDYYGARGNEAVKEFHLNELRVYNNVMEILTPSNMRPAEYLAIKNVTIGKFLEETAGGWEKWRSNEAITIDLPHDGLYGASEYGRQLKLAGFIKGTNPTGFDKSLTIEEYLKKFIK